MDNPWEVRTIQINVGGGDSAFHLLLKTENDKQHVESLVLADGGTGDNCVSISNLFTRLQNTGHTRANNAALEGFDVYFITHWDSDHYGGVYRLLYNGVWRSVDSWKDKHPKGTGADFAQAIASGDIRCPSTRYEPHKHGQKEPRPITRFYGPNSSYEKFDIREEASKGKYAWLVGIEDVVYFAIETKLGSKVLSGHVPLALVGDHGAGLLGIDLFSGHRPPCQGGSLSQKNGMTSPREISQILWKHFDQQRPAMICIGAYNQFCDPSHEADRFSMDWYHQSELRKIALFSKAPTDWDIIPFVESLYHPITPNVIMNDTTQVNEDSIACMVIWPDPNQALISHFVGGDLGYNQEERILRWAAVPDNENDPLSRRLCPHVQYVKLSHHGSKASTPLLMLFAWNPRTVTCSNGTNLKHNIISWETMLYICMWSQWRVNTLKDPESKRFYCTNVPGWLCRHLKNVELKGQQMAIYEYPLDVGNTTTALMEEKGAPFRALSSVLDNLNPGKLTIQLHQATSQQVANITCADICQFVYGEWDHFVSTPIKYFGLNIQTFPSFNIGPQALKLIFFQANKTKLTSCYFLGNEINQWTPNCQSCRDSERPDEWQHESSLPVNTDRQLVFSQPAVNDKTTTSVLSLHRRMRPTGGYSSLNAVSVMMMDDDYQLSDSLSSIKIEEEKDRNQLERRCGRRSLIYQEDSPFYFMSTAASFTKKGDASQLPFQQPRKFSNLDLFLGRMATGSLVLISKPEDSKPSIVHESDELRQWFATILEGSPTADLGFTVTFKDALIQCVQLTTKLTSCWTPVPDASFIFNTADNRNAFSPPISYSSWPVVDPTSPDIVGNAQVLCLTVNPSSSAYKFTFDGTHILSLLAHEPVLFSKLLAGVAKFQLDTSPGAKNALWFSPGYTSTATVRLRFVPTDGTKNLADNLREILQTWASDPKVTITPSDAYLVVKKVWPKAEEPTPPWTEFISHCKLDIKTDGGVFSVDTAVNFRTDATTWILFFNPNPEQDFFSVVASIAQLFGLESSIADQIRNIKGKIPSLTSIMIRRIAFTKYLEGWSLQISIQLVLGQMPFICTATIRDSEPVFEFYGRLFGENRPNKEGLGEFHSFIPYLPASEAWDAVDFAPVCSVTKGSDVGDLNSLYNITDDKHPATLPESPFDVRLIEMGFRYTGDILGFDATIMGAATATQSSAPSVRLAAAKVDLKYSTTKQALDHFSIATAILLHAPRSTQMARLYGKVEFQRSGTTFYRKSLQGADHVVDSDYILVDQEDDYRAVADGTWIFQGSVNTLSGAFIYSLCSDDCNEEMMQLLEHVSLDFGLTYTYTGKSGKSLVLDGTLHLGDLQLHCAYENNGPADWRFSADLMLENQTSSLLGVVEAICGKDLSAGLPDCIKNIVVAPAGSKDLTSLTIDNKDGWLVMYIRIQLTGNTSVLLYQVQKKRNPGETEKPCPPAKRVVFFKLDALPKIDNIPVVGSFSLNFTAIKFAFVSNGDKKSEEGLTGDEVDALNKNLPQGFDKIVCKAPAKKNTTGAKEEAPKPGLPKGFHFMIFDNDTVLLDYLFGRPDKNGKVVVMDENVPAPSPGLTPYNKKVGPVTITAVGLKFDMGDQKLTFLIDGSVQLGPLELSLSGFGLSFGFKGITLQDIGKVQLGFTLTGLGLSFVKSPIALAGYLEHSQTDQLELFQGGAALGFNPWLFQAGGYYALQRQDKKPPPPSSYSDMYKCFIAYARLSGPIATIGYAEIREVSGGLGYNTAMRFPTMENIMNFPFISDPPSNPATAIQALAGAGGWITNQADSNWIAVGMTVLAFQMLTVRTVVVVEWDRNIKLGLFGIATADIPKQLDKKFARVQLGLAATIDFDAGVLKIDGQLTPASFILDPNCHLTGGFALYSWFGAGSGDSQGDWVFTIGGYHAIYQAKPQYPRPPRLGISWSFDANINISGEAYFAITPVVCMAGGRLHVSLQLGALYAYFDAWADLLINYKPFHYQAQGGVSVGVRFTLDLWLVSLSIAVDLGATLYLEGSPMSGKVHVDFWVFGFDVNFGVPAELPGPIGSDAFWKLVLQADTSSQAGRLPQIFSQQEPVEEAEDLKPHIFSATSGLLPKKTDNPQVWTVQGTIFALTITFKFPILGGNIITKIDKDTQKTVPIENPKAGDMYAKPMQLTKKIQKSSMDIQIERMVAPHLRDNCDDDPGSLDPVWRHQEARYSALPVGLWGQYDKNSDPNQGAGNQDSTLLNGATQGTVQLMTGIQLRAPTCLRSKDCLPAFDAELAMRQPIDPPGECSKPIDPVKAWEPDGQKDPQYDAVKATWKGKQPAAIELVAFWEQLDCFNWVPKEAPQAPSSPPPVKQLIPQYPSRLVDALDQYLVESPMMSQG
ncbi:hypothetical protein AYL99_03685 [Fonsecaea erecta]|uniref:DUF6603 domain-containing protein n=1 Tax=Fonsecaea erecta TaxID=1367422 RepID=A0A178ZPA7_9EURO|nr:hypothetical protein AYL99_03685 [Fonsecaea erecta]OAP61482.1 hypothetical protein AYL99_03685 [Fonsecaea erecta]